MKVSTTKSKNAESFYITQSYVDNNGKNTSKIIRKLGTLAELSEMLHTDRDGVMAWAKEQARIETQKYQEEKDDQVLLIPFHTEKQLEPGKQNAFTGGYLFLQYIYYQLRLDQTCKKIQARHKFDFDLNAILSDLIYARILEPGSKRSAFRFAQSFLEPPSYELHDVYRALSVLAEESDFIQSEVYKNSAFLGKRNDRILYYDCTNFYFEIEQEDGMKRYGKSKEHRPNPIVQMGLFMDGDGIPLAFSLFDGNRNEQTSLKPLEKKVLHDFGCEKFIYCSDAGLGSEENRFFNHLGERAYIVTQSIRKLPAEDREWALERKGFRRVSDDRKVELSALTGDDTALYYKEEPYTTKKLDQRLIVTYSPKYAAYQKQIRERQVDRARKMLQDGKHKKQRKNPNDPGRFIGKYAVTEDGEVGTIQYYLDEERIAEEARYDGLYAVCTDLLEDPVEKILAVSEARWRIEECFRTMKTDFSARPVHVRREDRIKAHFLTCFLALTIFRFLQRLLGNRFTGCELIRTLREMNFADVEQQGYLPLYTRTDLTDALHEACGFRTDYRLIRKQKMREIRNLSKSR